ncbi:MAG: PAS domain-containing sensor histidine kinase [Candidatus Pacebacteria bacterium]|nr:PAS domain-containing sensor histidine kinase [Candidatus Paceibacterota bacterium]
MNKVKGVEKKGYAKYGFVIFFVSIGIVWMLGDMLAGFLLGYDPFDPRAHTEVIARAKTLLFIFSSAFIGVCTYLTYLLFLKGLSLEKQGLLDIFATPPKNNPQPIEPFKKTIPDEVPTVSVEKSVSTSQVSQEEDTTEVLVDHESVLSPQQLTILYDNSPVPYFVMDDSGNVRSANKATMRFFSATPEDFQVANLYTLISNMHRNDSAHAVALLVSKVQRGVSISEEEVTFKTYKDEERIALMSIYSIDRGNVEIPFRHLVALHDVTKDREAEEIKTDFLLLASHQLRTPTTTIKWYVDYMLDTKSFQLNEDAKGCLQEIYTANKRMMDLVSTLLTVSRIEMGTLAPEYAQVSLGAVAEDVFEELASDIGKKKIVVTKNIPKESDALTDKTMVRIIIHNLLTNAIKYTHEGGVVQLDINDKGMSRLIVVKDSGCGIPVAEQSRIFSKMFRASNARKMSAQGTGLGLFMTKMFVEKLGGTLSFESLEGKGTIFTITLPRVAPDA